MPENFFADELEYYKKVQETQIEMLIAMHGALAAIKNAETAEQMKSIALCALDGINRMAVEIKPKGTTINA